MPKDKVIHPPKEASRESGIKSIKSSMIEGPTATMENLQPYNRNGKK